MFNDEKTPLDKAIGVVSILSDVTIDRIKKVATMYQVPYKAILAVLSPVKINDRVIYVPTSKLASINSIKQARKQWSRKKSIEIKRHGPNVYTNRKHARNTLSGNAPEVQDPKRVTMRQRVISDITESKKEYINKAWDKLTSH